MHATQCNLSGELPFSQPITAFLFKYAHTYIFAGRCIFNQLAGPVVHAQTRTLKRQISVCELKL